MVEIAWRTLFLKDKLLGSKSTLTKETARSVFSRFDYSAQKVKNRLTRDFISWDESIRAYAPFYLGNQV